MFKSQSSESVLQSISDNGGPLKIVVDDEWQTYPIVKKSMRAKVSE